MTSHSDLLDAFSQDDFSDPALAQVDAVARRLVARPSPARRFHLAVPVLVAAAAFFAAVLWGLSPADRPPGEIETSVVVASPTTARGVRAVLVRPELVSRPVASSPAEEGAGAPPRAEGLLPHPSAELVVVGTDALLSAGVVDFVRDDAHVPRVDRVVWPDLALVADPVGTVFRASAARDVAVLSVSQGQVALRTRDGASIALLSPGDEVVAVAEPRSPFGALLLHTGGTSLDRVLDKVPDDCTCRPEDVVSALARLRLSTLEDR